VLCNCSSSTSYGARIFSFWHDLCGEGIDEVDFCVPALRRIICYLNKIDVMSTDLLFKQNERNDNCSLKRFSSNIAAVFQTELIQDLLTRPADGRQ
jgi:hypothetical protein